MPAKNLQYWLQEKEFPVNLTFSINPLGPSLEIKKRVRFDLSQYPNPQKLINLLSARFLIPKENICVGNGVNKFINLICLLFMGKKGKVLLPQVTYPRYEEAVKTFGGKPIFVPMKKDLRIDFVAFEEKFKKLKEKPKLIFIANPNNPTGLVEEKEKILRLAQKTKALVVVDEAGIEFVGEKFSVIKEASKMKNLLVLRSFSKAYGLAGLRIGFCVGAVRVIKELQKIESPFPLSSVAIESAILALKDKNHLMITREFFKKEMEFMKKELEKMGLEVLPIESTNLLAKVPSLFSSAKELVEKLNERGANCLTGDYFNLPKFIRICPATKKVNRKFVKIVKEIVKEKSQHFSKGR